MAENLNYQPTSGNSWCYGNSADSCTKYGRLYDWATAMDIGTSYNSSTWGGSDVNRQGVCPDGWHLPSRTEWVELAKFAGGTYTYGTGGTAGTKLKSSIDWIAYSGIPFGTDDYGFSALPGGFRSVGSGGGEGSFSSNGKTGEWWTATEYTEYSSIDIAYRREMDYDNEYVDNTLTDKKAGLSVRCVKDND
jgi:uncharacterized protein (TIGR02145 family)